MIWEKGDGYQREIEDCLSIVSMNAKVSLSGDEEMHMGNIREGSEQYVCD